MRKAAFPGGVWGAAPAACAVLVNLAPTNCISFEGFLLILTANYDFFSEIAVVANFQGELAFFWGFPRHETP